MASLSCPASLQRFDMGLELGPARKAVLPGDLKLRLGERLGLAGLEEVLGLILEMPEVGILGKLARVPRSAGHGNLLSVGARCPHDGPKEGSHGDAGRQVGFYPFRGPDASCTRRWIVQG